METLRRYKFVLIIVAVVVLGFAGYNFFFTGGGDDDAVLVSEPVDGAGTSGGELLVLLNTLRAIELDTSFLDDPLFVGLIDFSVTIDPEPVGRTNPFAPLGVGSVVISEVPVGPEAPGE